MALMCPNFGASSGSGEFFVGGRAVCALADMVCVNTQDLRQSLRYCP